MVTAVQVQKCVLKQIEFLVFGTTIVPLCSDENTSYVAIILAQKDFLWMEFGVSLQRFISTLKYIQCNFL